MDTLTIIIIDTDTHSDTNDIICWELNSCWGNFKTFLHGKWNDEIWTNVLCVNKFFMMKFGQVFFFFLVGGQKLHLDSFFFFLIIFFFMFEQVDVLNRLMCELWIGICEKSKWTFCLMCEQVCVNSLSSENFAWNLERVVYWAWKPYFYI